MKYRGLVVATALLLTAAGSGTAQTPQLADFDSYCTVGTMRTCASVRVWTVWDPTALVTRVQMWVRNLQGSHPLENTGGAPISGLGIIFPAIKNASNLSITTVGGAEVIGNPGSLWGITNRQIEGPVSFSTTTTSPEGSIMGCATFPTTTVNYYRTCGTGWVVFGFTTQNQWSAVGSEIAWKVRQNPGSTQYFLACRTADAFGDPEYCEAAPTGETVTPEPISLALMSTGLAGLAAFRRRRKRPEDADPTA